MCNFLFNIGDTIKTKTKDLVILDRKYDEKTKKKLYKIKCNVCGFNSGEYYFKGEKYNEYWIKEYNLSNNQFCPCCHNTIIVKDINSIYATDPWMLDYFKNKEDGFKYSRSSNREVEMICKYCKSNLGYKKINNLYTYKKVSCVCDDYISFPNKISYYLFQDVYEQLNNYEREYSPNWISPYRYDNFIVLKNNKQYIIEMDGAIGHGNFMYRSTKRDTKLKERDLYKDKKAKEHNIEVIRIDCIKSNFEYIKSNLIKNLSNILDLNDVNWEKIYLHSLKNLVIEVCNIYNKIHKVDVSLYPFQLCRKSIKNYLRIGTELGLCDYKSLEDIQYEKAKILSNAKIKNPNISVKELSILIGSESEHYHSVYKYMKLANDLGMYNFDIENEKRISKSKGLNESRYKKYKPILAYDANMNFIKTFDNTPQAIQYFKNEYNINLWAANISKVCRGECRHTGGFIFKYAGENS